MLQQATPFTWYFTDPALGNISLGYCYVDKVFVLRRRTILGDRYLQVSPLSRHTTLEDAALAAQALLALLGNAT
jgi:hypothetical protein